MVPHSTDGRGAALPPIDLLSLPTDVLAVILWRAAAAAAADDAALRSVRGVDELSATHLDAPWWPASPHPPLPVDGDGGVLPPLHLTPPVARWAAGVASTCSALRRVWAGVVARAVTSVDVGSAANVASVVRAVGRVPKLRALAVRERHHGALRRPHGDHVVPYPRLSHALGPARRVARRGLTSFSYVGVALPGGLPRVLAAAPHAGSLRELVLATGNDLVPEERALLRAVGPRLTRLVWVHADSGGNAPFTRPLPPLPEALAGVGAALTSLTTNLRSALDVSDALWLVGACPHLEALTLLGYVRFDDGCGGGTQQGNIGETDIWMHDLSYTIDDPVDDEPLAALVAGLPALAELVLAAAIDADNPWEDWPPPGTVAPAPTSAGLREALDAAPSLRRFALATCAHPGATVEGLPASLPRLTGLRLDWSTAQTHLPPDFELAPAVAALATPGRLPGLEELALTTPPGVVCGGWATAAALSRLPSLRCLRLTGVAARTVWAVLSTLALPRLVTLALTMGGSGFVGGARVDLRHRCGALRELTLARMEVGEELVACLTWAGVAVTLLRCTTRAAQWPDEEDRLAPSPAASWLVDCS